MDTRRNIVLVGFMGTGKTCVGNALAERLGLSFIDMDDVIVEREGRPITDIFATDGETYFRSVERTVARDLSAQSGHVIATGGGIVLNPANIRDFERTGLVVCLQATPDAILERVRHDTSRPLLHGGEKLQKILSILETRKPLYDAIAHQVETSTLNIGQVVDRIAELYNQAA
jgi:shikimate kinase